MKNHQIDAIARKLTDDGKLIEAGWVHFKNAMVPDIAPSSWPVCAVLGIAISAASAQGSS